MLLQIIQLSPKNPILCHFFSLLLEDFFLLTRDMVWSLLNWLLYIVLSFHDDLLAGLMLILIQIELINSLGVET